MMNKKMIAAILMTAMTASLLAGCGSSSSEEAAAETATEASTEEEEVTYGPEAYVSGINVADYVTLPDYSEIPVEMYDPRDEVTDEYVDQAVQSSLEYNQELVDVTDRAVQNGDVVNIDYVGKVDGVAFDGGTAEGYDLTIGSNRFIDDFETQLIGWEIGDSDTIEVTFPKTYENNPSLAGKDATFDVTINGIQEYQTPELTDEWVAEQGIDGVSTVEEYKEYARTSLMESAQTSYDESVQAYALQYLADSATWAQDPPTEMVDRIYNTTMQNIESMASVYGMDVSTIVSYYGYDPDTYEEQFRNQALETAKQNICIQAVAEAEDMLLTDAEYNTQLAVLAASYGYDDADTFEETCGENEVRESILRDRVSEFLQGRAVVTEPAADETEAVSETTTEADEAATEAAEADTEATEE